MWHLLDLLVWNLLISVPIAMVVWLLCQTRALRQRPAACHGLWLLVLLKMVKPPLIPIPMLPAISLERDLATCQHSDSETGMNSVGNLSNEELAIAPVVLPDKRQNQETTVNLKSSIPRPGGSTTRVEPSSVTRKFAWRVGVIGLLGTSLLVSLVIWCGALRQIRRVRRLLRGNSAASGRRADLVQEMSRQFNLRPAPDLLFVDASIAPMLWAGAGDPTIVLPRQLADSLDDDHLRNVVAHEISHYVRRDHWANLFAFFVTSLFWWNPIAWLARREMAIAAEASCDAFALERTANSRRSYAVTLLTVVDFINSHRPLQPTLAVSYGESRSITRRFELITNSNIKARVSRSGRILLLFAAIALSVIPTRAQKPSDRSTPPKSVSTPASSTPHGLRKDADRQICVQSPASRLAGAWSMQSISRGEMRDYVQNGYVLFGSGPTGKSGFIRDEAGRKPFTYRITEHDGDLWIDVIAQNVKTLGLCELSDDNRSARLCFQFSESGFDIVRPKSFEEVGSHTIITLRRIRGIPDTAVSPAAKADTTSKGIPNTGYRPLTKADTILSSSQNVPADTALPVLPQTSLQVLGPQIPSDQEGVPFIPGPMPLVDNPLRGRWTAHVDPAGPDRYETGELFAFFGGGFGLLSDVGGTAPNPFRFYLAEKGGQLQIDLTFSEDWGWAPPQPGAVETQYGTSNANFLENGR